MRKVELVKGIPSSVLGFGCAPIMGSKDAASARRAVDCALDCGINHFDLARSYGYGEAEKFVGKLIASKRDKIILTSKFGIKARKTAKYLRTVKPFVRFLLKETAAYGSNKNGGKNTNISQNLHYKVSLNVMEMRKSLEESLKALGTDYLDYFLIHEPLEQLINFPQLWQEAEKLKEEGKIRAWGLAFKKDQQQLHSMYLNGFDVLQFNNSPDDKDYEHTLKERGTGSNIFFSPLNNRKSALTPEEKLRKIGDDFRRSVIVCSMYTEKHIISNASLFE